VGDQNFVFITFMGSHEIEGPYHNAGLFYFITLTQDSKQGFRRPTGRKSGTRTSDLLRLSKWVQMGHNDEAIVDLIRRIAWLMEWMGDFASPDLADMQREICRWRRVWPVERGNHILALRASQMSNRI
jgi:hypothetical protein